MFRLRVLTACAALCFLVATTMARADDYPDHPIRVVLTYTAGGVSDQVMRVLAPKMQEVLGQQLVIEAKPGAAGNLGTMEVTRAAPDGYTVVVTATNNFVINQFTMKLAFDPLTAMIPVARLADVPLVLLSNPQMPVKNFAELVAYVKAHPGQVNYSSPAAGTVNHMLLERIKQTRDLDMQHVAFRGSPEGVMALMRNDVQLFTVGYAAVIGELKAGQLTALAVATDERLPELPDVPTLTESGFPGFSAANWWGMAVPAGTPEAVVKKLRDAVRQALQEPSVSEHYKTLGLSVPKETPEQFAAGLKAEAALWEDVVKRGHISLQ